jgi:hypothetical protein
VIGLAANSTREDRRDLNAVFQRLVCVLGYDSVEALDEILQKLRRSRGGLPVTFYIRGGARSRDHDECAPPEGVTGPVLPAAWINRTMELILVGDRLDVHYGSIMGFARADTTFSVDWYIVEQIWPLPVALSADWHVVEQTWPLPAAKAPASVTMPPVTEVNIDAPAHATISERARPTDVETIRLLAKARGWSDDRFYKMSTGRVMKTLGDALKKLEGDEYHERNRSTYRRAQRRLKD